MKKQVAQTHRSLFIILIGFLCLLAFMGIVAIFVPTAAFDGINSGFDWHLSLFQSLIAITVFFSCGMLGWLALQKARSSFQRHFASACMVAAAIAATTCLLTSWSLLDLPYPYDELAMGLLTVPLWFAHTCALLLFDMKKRLFLLCRSLTFAATLVATVCFIVGLSAPQWISSWNVVTDGLGFGELFMKFFSAFFIFGVLGTIVTILLHVAQGHRQ